MRCFTHQVHESPRTGCVTGLKHRVRGALHNENTFLGHAVYKSCLSIPLSGQSEGNYRNG